MNKWINYVLLLTSIFVAILIAEVFLRTFVPEIGWAQRKEPIIGWSSDEYKQFDPGQVPKDKTKKRILFLGDSFLAGSGISDLEKRAPILLESLLSHKVSSRIISAGGWGTDQQLLAFKQKGQFWEPDLVFVAFCANNDISDILSHHHGANKLKPYFVIGKHNTLELSDGYGMPINYKTVFQAEHERVRKNSQSIRIYLLDYIRYFFKTLNFINHFNYNGRFQAVDVRYRTYQFWKEKTKEIYDGQIALSWSPQNSANHVSAYIHDNLEMNTYQWKLFESILVELNKEVENSGGKLIVMILPVIFNPENSETIAGGSFAKSFQTPEGHFTFRSDEPIERLRVISERVGSMFFDPTQDFIKYVSDNDLMKAVWPNPNDRHFSELGHEVLADLLKEYMKMIMKKDENNDDETRQY